MAEFDFYVDLEDALTGERLGSGPLETVSRWSYTARFDRAGTISMQYAASDAQAALVTNRVLVRAFALLDDVWTEVGAGIVDTITISPDGAGMVTCVATGLDLMRELSYRGVGDLEIGAGTGATHAAALTAIGAYAPLGWTFTPAADPGSDYLYAKFDGESVLGGLVHLADRTLSHFYRSADRTLVFVSEFESSGVRAVQAEGELAAEECAIVSLRRMVDTKDLLTRIYPYGEGADRKSSLTLRSTTRSAPSGYTLNATGNYIENDIATAAYGLIDFPAIEFKEIGPIASTSADVRAASNQLFDAALEELRRRSTLADQQTFDLSVAGCSQLLRPLQTVRLVYRDDEQGIAIDENLYILEATWEVDATGIRTSRLVVSTDDRWPDSDGSAAAERAVQGRVYQAHTQMGPNSYWENGVLYIGSDQANHIAEMPFVLGDEVMQVQQVRFRYKVDAVLGFTSIVVGAVAVDFDVEVDSLSVTVSGTIDISHTHVTPDHQHTVTIAGGTGGGETLLVGTAGGLGFLQKASAGDAAVNTNTDEGGATSNSGGSASLSLSGVTGTGTGSGTGSVDLSSAIATSTGVYRAAADRTYDIADLEFQINGGGWVDLDTGADKGDGYFEVDITDQVQESDTFRPLQENNLIEVRRKTGAGLIALEGVAGNGTVAVVSTNPTAHGLAVGEAVIITGTTNFNGVHTVINVINTVQFEIAHASSATNLGVGSIELNKSAMIYAKVGIRSTIQATAFV